MQFVVVAHDGKNMLEKRMSVRPGHLENIARMKAKGQVVIAGGILDDEGKMAGSVLVLDFENRDQLDEYLAKEPYYTKHVWEDVRIDRYNAVVINNQSV